MARTADHFLNELITSAEYMRRRLRFEVRLPGELHELELPVRIHDAGFVFGIHCRGCQRMMHLQLEFRGQHSTTVECGRCGDLTQVVPV